jgi:hypothetical protein
LRVDQIVNEAWIQTKFFRLYTRLPYKVNHFGL